MSFLSLCQHDMHQASEWKQAEESLRSLLLRLIKGDDRIWQPTVTELLAMFEVRPAHLDFHIQPRNILYRLPVARLACSLLDGSGSTLTVRCQLRACKIQIR